MPRATLSRLCIAAAATFALGAPSAFAAASRESVVSPQLEIRVLAVHGHDVTVAVWTSRGTLREVSLTVRRDDLVIAHRLLTEITPRHRTVVFTVAGTGGRLSVAATATEHHRRSTTPRRQTTSTTSS